MMELWIYNSRPFVEIYYKNSSREALHLEIPNCGKSCPLVKFIQLYDDVLPGDFDVECKNGTRLEIIAGFFFIIFFLYFPFKIILLLIIFFQDQ